MGTFYFQQQSAAYNIYQKNDLHIFTPDGRRYLVGASGKSYADYASEVQEHLVPFEVEALLAQRDSLRVALTRRYLTQHFGVGGDAHFAGMELDSVSAELKQRGIPLGTIKPALRSAANRATHEVEDIWPIRKSRRNLQYTCYDIVFSKEEANTQPQRQKIWDTVAAWASTSKLPAKEGARLATVQDWDDMGNDYGIRVDLHHYSRPDMNSCRAIALIDVAERNKDMDVLRQALARIGVNLADLSGETYTAPQNLSPRTATLDRPEPSLADTVAAVRFERERLDQQLRLLSDALTNHEERQLQAQRIASLEQEKSSLETLLRGMANTLDKLVWPKKPADWANFPPIEKGLHVLEALEHTLTALDQSDKSLQIAKSELRLLTGRAQNAETERDRWKNRAENTESTLRAELQKQHDAWKNRTENIESTLRAELLKQHEAALLAQEIDFTRQLQNVQQERMREAQQLQDEYMRQMEEQQDMHLKQIQKLRRLVPAQNILHVEAEGWNTPSANISPSRMRTSPHTFKPIGLELESLSQPVREESKKEAMAAELGQYQAESREIFDTRINEYIKIAKDQGLSQADAWLLAEAKKLAEIRSRQGVLGI